ncbi:MAG: hypothetical protein QOJ46_867 [bacterium]|jgi:hypothetical protein
MGSRRRKQRPGGAPARPEAAAPADGERVAPLAASAAASALSADEEREAAADAPDPPLDARAVAADAHDASADPMLDRYARGRARDETVRMSLEPLAPGERPGAVTLAAMVAFVFAIANVVATLTVDDLASSNGNPTAVAVATTAVLVLAGIGMLARKYWAVLGFQCILGLQIVVFSLALSRVQKWWVGLALVVAIGLLGWLFWKLIRAMARLQMPDRPGNAESTR